MFMYYTVCYFTGILYAVVRQISMLFIDNKDSVFCLQNRDVKSARMGLPKQTVVRMFRKNSLSNTRSPC